MQFKKIKEAYDVLSNPDKKRMYDQQGEEAVREDDDGGMDVDWSDIFREFFGGFGTERRDRTEDMVQKLRLSLEDLYTGTSKSFSVRRQKICQTCNG